MSWTPRPLKILRRSHGSLPRVAGAELGLADEVVVATPGPVLLKPRNDEDARIRSGIQFLSSARCSHRFGVYDLVELTVFGIVSFCWV